MKEAMLFHAGSMLCRWMFLHVSSWAILSIYISEIVLFIALFLACARAKISVNVYLYMSMYFNVYIQNCWNWQMITKKNECFDIWSRGEKKSSTSVVFTGQTGFDILYRVTTHYTETINCLTATGSSAVRQTKIFLLKLSSSHCTDSCFIQLWRG